MPTPLRAYFINRSKAKNASERLLRRFPHCEASIDVTGDAYLLTVTYGAASERLMAETLLREEGGRIEAPEIAPVRLRLVVG